MSHRCYCDHTDTEKLGVYRESEKQTKLQHTEQVHVHVHTYVQASFTHYSYAYTYSSKALLLSCFINVSQHSTAQHCYPVRELEKPQLSLLRRAALVTNAVYA